MSHSHRDKLLTFTKKKNVFRKHYTRSHVNNIWYKFFTHRHNAELYNTNYAYYVCDYPVDKTKSARYHNDTFIDNF